MDPQLFDQTFGGFLYTIGTDYLWLVIAGGIVWNLAPVVWDWVRLARREWMHHWSKGHHVQVLMFLTVCTLTLTVVGILLGGIH